MKFSPSTIFWFWIPALCAITIDPFQIDMLNVFYDVFVCDEKNIVASVELSPECEGVSHTVPSGGGGGTPVTPCGTLLSPPTIAPMSVPNPVPGTTAVPYIFVNNTGLPDSEVYILIYGTPVIGGAVSPSNLQYVSFGVGSVTDTVGTYVPVTAAQTPPSTDYSYTLEQIPLTGGQKILYIPYLQAGILLFSIHSPLDLTVSPGSIAIPVATDPTDPNYSIVYSGMEMTFYPPGFTIGGAVQNQLTLDFTCVDYFGFPIYFNLFTQNPLTTIPQNRPSGIYQSRHYVLCSLQNSFATAVGNAKTQWEGLIQTSGSTILRIAAPGYSMTNAGGTFDAQYLDNASEYGFSWANDVWTGSDPFYGASNNNQLQVAITGGYGTIIYTGQVTKQEFVFTATNPKNVTEIFSIPWVNVGSHDPSIEGTTAGIMRIAQFFPQMTYASSSTATAVPVTTALGDAVVDRATKLTEYLASSIMVGLIPGRVTSLSTSGFSPNVYSEYYQTNPYLSSPGPSTGPWFDLYSRGLLANAAQDGNAVYAYAFDDYLYTQSTTLNVAPSQESIDNTTCVTVVFPPYSDN